jgi:hypothetical protein
VKRDHSPDQTYRDCNKYSVTDDKELREAYNSVSLHMGDAIEDEKSDKQAHAKPDAPVLCPNCWQVFVEDLLCKTKK